MNIADRLNAAIARFVTKPENAALHPATGGYSTPFRGQLFGHQMAADVEAELGGRRASLLFLGSNPNCPGSLMLLKANDHVNSHWPEFERQMKSGYFGERAVDDTGAVRAWDPIHNPASMGRGQRFSWTFYVEAFRDGGASLDAAAMANVFSWGSGTLNELISHLRAYDPNLLERVVEFANAQLLSIITALRPGLVVCPRRVSEHPALRGLALSQANIRNVRAIGPSRLQGRPFPMYMGEMVFEKHPQRVLFLNHPSALRRNLAPDRPVIREAMVSAIRTSLGSPGTSAT